MELQARRTLLEAMAVGWAARMLSGSRCLAIKELDRSAIRVGALLHVPRIVVSAHHKSGHAPK